MAQLFGNPTGIGYTPGNIDLATQQAALDRKRQIMQALLLQQMQSQPTQMAGPIAIRESPLAAVAKMLTGYAASKGMSSIDDQERQLVLGQQQKAAQAVNDLMQSSMPQPGTPTTVTEMPGPMPDGQSPNLVTQDGTPPAFDMGKFGQAYAKAQYAGVDPALLGSMLQQFNRGRLLTQMGYGNLVPGGQQGQGTFTPGDTTHGAVLTMPAGGGGAPQGGAGFGGVPGTAAALMISGDPALEKLGGAINEQAKPVSGRAGAPMWARDANGNLVMAGFSPSVEKGQIVNPDQSVSTAPGYLKSAAEIQNQQEAIAAGYKPVTMKTSDGSETQGYLAQGGRFVPFGGGGAAPAPGSTVAVNIGAGGASGTGNVMPSGYAGGSRASADAGRLSILQGELANLQAQPDSPQKAQNIASLQQEIALTSGAPSAQGAAPAQFNRSQSTADKAFAEGQGANLAKQFQTYRDSGDQAAIGRASVSQMMDSLNGFNPNAAAPERQKLAELVQAMPGLNLTADSPLVKKIAGGDLSAMQEFSKLAYGNAASQLRSLLPGQRLTQMEILQNYLNSPNPRLQRASIQTMLQMQDGMYRWAQDRADATANYTGNPAQFSAQWNRSHPLTGTDASGQPYVPTLAQVKQQLADAQSAAAPPANAASKTIGGVTYVNVNGQWYRQ